MGSGDVAGRSSGIPRAAVRFPRSFSITAAVAPLRARAPRSGCKGQADTLGPAFAPIPSFSFCFGGASGCPRRRTRTPSIHDEQQSSARTRTDGAGKAPASVAGRQRFQQCTRRAGLYQAVAELGSHTNVGVSGTLVRKVSAHILDGQGGEPDLRAVVTLFGGTSYGWDRSPGTARASRSRALAHVAAVRISPFTRQTTRNHGVAQGPRHLDCGEFWQGSSPDECIPAISSTAENGLSHCPLHSPVTNRATQY